MKKLNFSDVLIVPKFSTIFSRKDVESSHIFLGQSLWSSVISSNMDSVTEIAMSKEMISNGGQAALHRFCSIEDNVRMLNESHVNIGSARDRFPYVSIGVGKKELERFEALFDAGASHFILDLAHGASMNAVLQAKELYKLKGSNFKLIVGNFATRVGINDFNYALGGTVDAYKCGIGTGSVCRTSQVTGVGYPAFSSLQDCVSTQLPIIWDGGIGNSGDLCKAVAAGAKLVMLGSMLAGCDESPGKTHYSDGSISKDDEASIFGTPVGKEYRGSASCASYEAQGKTADHRTPEGVETLVPYTGPVKEVLNQLEAALRSSASYVGANNLEEYRKFSEFIEV